MGRILPDGFIASSGLTPTNSSTPTIGSMKMLWRFLASEPGLTAIKDCLIVAGIALAVITIVNGIGAKLTSVNTSLNKRFSASRRRTVSP
jgi:pilus assembly protein Flp/PilA